MSSEDDLFYEEKLAEHRAAARAYDYRYGRGAKLDARRKCSCGSGKQRYALHDACGIFCTFVCQDCEQTKRARFRPDIFTDPDYWTDEPVEES